MVLTKNISWIIVFVLLSIRCQSIPSNIDIIKDKDGIISTVVLYSGNKDSSKEFEIFSFRKNGNFESWHKVNEHTDIAKVVKYYDDGSIRFAAEYLNKEQYGTAFDYSNKDSSGMRIRKYISKNMSILYSFHFDMYVNIIAVLGENGEIMYSEKYKLHPFLLYTVGDTGYAKFIDRKYDFESYILDEKRFGVWNNKVRKLKDIKVTLGLK